MMAGLEDPVFPAVRRLIPVLALVLALGGLSPAAAQDRPVVNGDTGRTLDEYLSRLERFGYSGGALAVRGKDVLLMKAYGLADRARGVPLTTGSVYSLGSITKQFTAAAILTLEMQGKLSVTDPVSKYLDGVPADKAAITLHHLLTHSSGLASDFSPTDFDPVGRDEYVRRAVQSSLLFKPGEGYEYSNAGYSLLAAIVEKVSGQPYEVYLTETGAETGGHARDGIQAAQMGTRAGRARVHGRQGLGHHPPADRGAGRAVLDAAGQRRAAHDARRHARLASRARD